MTEHIATGVLANLGASFFNKNWVALPPLIEQRAIASILSEMDEALSALERRREKTRALKKGMMQELLTGKTRLI
jgi:type I restriction enzyme S subunit